MIEIFRYSVGLVREKSFKYGERINIQSPLDVFNFLKTIREIYLAPKEKFFVIGLDTAGSILGYSIVFKGSIDLTIARPREIFQTLLLMNARSCIIGHNHPSGDVTPSDMDKESTKDIVAAGKIIGIEVIDHLIIGSGTNLFYSFNQGGLI